MDGNSLLDGVTMDEILSIVTQQILPHWPFVVTTVIFAIIGQVMSKSVFTRERAYKKQKSQPFWWWGRETLPLHSISSGALIGLMWHNPEGADPAWGLAASVGYFAGAGAASLFAWAIARGFLKKKGIDLDQVLPGGTQSMTPPPVETELKEEDIVEEGKNS